MTGIKRVAIFAYPDHMYVNMLLGLKRGFEELGVECHVGWNYLEGRYLSSFVDNYQPDIVVEIDRFLDQIDGFQGNIRHVAWVQNHFAFGRRVHENATGSEKIFMMDDPNQLGFGHLPPESFSYLQAGIDPAIFNENETHEVFDFSVIGYMYPPLSEEALETVIDINGQPVFRVVEMVESFMASNIDHCKWNFARITQFILDFLSTKGHPLSEVEIPRTVRWLCDEYLLRLKDRKKISEWILGISRNVAFFGTPDWASWPQFAPYYRGSLNRADELASAYRATRVNVHNGPFTMHVRVLESMACGKPVLVNDSSRAGTPVGIENFFEPGVHYIPYALDEFPQIAERALKDPAWRARIGRAAAEEVRRAHTWRHRAQQILDEL